MFAEMLRLATGPAGEVYLTWRERNANKTDTRILVTRSLDGGRRWEEAPRQLAGGDHLGPPYLLTGPDGTVHVAWLGGDEFLRILEVATSRDSGKTFAPEPARIQPVFAKSDRGIANPGLAADKKGRVYAVWEESSSRKKETGIYLSRSEDHGRTWAKPLLVSRPGPDSRGSYMPRIAIGPDEQVYVIWEEAEVRTIKLKDRRRPEWRIDRMIDFNRSLDGGHTWLSQSIRLNRPHPMSLNRLRSQTAQIVGDGNGHVYVAFVEREGLQTRRLVVLHSADSGATWAAPAELGQTSLVKGQIEDVVLAHNNDGHLWLAWQEHAFGPRYGWFVLMNRSEDHGQRWADQAVIMDGPAEGQTTGRGLLVGAGANGLVLAAWDHGLRVYQPIVLNRSADGGKSWSQSHLPLN